MVATPTTTAPIELMAAQADSDTFTLPTGARIFQRGTVASAIYGVRRGIVELQGNEGDKTCYRPGELFSFRDIVWHQGLHHSGTPSPKGSM